jgi:hypothetical protein
MKRYPITTAKGYGADDSCSIPGNARFFSFPERQDRICGPLSLLSNRYLVTSFSGVKQQGRQADILPPSSAEVKKDGAITSTPLCVFMSQSLIN